MFVDLLRRDVGAAVRGFRQRPAFTAAAVATLALGIGGNAAVFGVVDRLLLRPPAHIVEPGRVVRFHTSMGSATFGSFTTPLGDYAGFASLRDHGRSFERVAALLAREVTLGRGPDAQLVQGSLVSASLFPLLGVRPALGRFFSDDEDRAGAAPVVVLGHDLWRARFGGDRAVLGRVVPVQGSRYTVVGVAPPGFTGVALTRTDLWLPLHVAAPEVLGNATGSSWQQMGGFWMEFVARLRPGVTAAAASAEATALVRGAQLFGVSEGAALVVRTGSVIPGRGPDPSREVRVAVWLAATSVVVLLIACANVANLLLARAVERRREIAVRLALGAGRARLMSQLLVEGLLLAALGGVAALAVAYAGAHVLRRVLLPNVVWATSLVDVRILAVTAAVALLTGVLTSLVPSLQASRPDLTSALKLGGRSGGSSAHTSARVSLLVAQAALSVVLLVGGGLLVRSLHNVRSAELGFDTERALVATVDLKGIGYSRQQVAEFFDRAADAARALPGVERVSLAAAYPFGHGFGGTLSVPGRDSLPQLPSGGPYEYDVSPGYFTTMGTPLLRGRDFTEADGASAPPVLIVNETLARLYWPGQEAVGQCVKIGGSRSDRCAQVVGVVANVRRYALHEDAQLLFYTPLAQVGDDYAGATRALLVRPRGDPAAFAPSLRAAVGALAPDLPFVRVTTFAALVEPQIYPWRMGARLFTVFGALALLVAAVGLYSVVSFGVLQRRREFGIRLALGAQGGDVVRLVVGEGLRYAAAGIALGLALALAAAPLVRPMLHDVSPRDPLTYGVVALILFGVAAVASALPSRRAARMDPASVLRAD